MLSRSEDETTSTILWDCTAGEFVWHYDIDETIYFLEGAAIIGDATNPPRRFVAGDVLFLPKGAVADWKVESYVRKVAFCRRVQPRIVGQALRVAGAAKRLLTGARRRRAVAVPRRLTARDRRRRDGRIDLDLLRGRVAPGNVRMMGPRTHGAWLGSTVFDGARAFEGVTPDLGLHLAGSTARRPRWDCGPW